MMDFLSVMDRDDATCGWVVDEDDLRVVRCEDFERRIGYR